MIKRRLVPRWLDWKGKATVAAGSSKFSAEQTLQ